MSVSEGPPVLTPEQEDELRLYAMRPEGHGLRVSRAAVAGVLSALAREREARERLREWNQENDEARGVLEGRVRDLQEALELLATTDWTGVTEAEECSAWVRKVAREALVGLPERREA